MGAWFVWAAESFSDGRLFFRSSVVGPAMADLLFLSYHVKVTDDRRSAESMRLVEYRALALAALPRFGVPCRHGRRIWKLQVEMMACHPQGGAPLPTVVDFGSSSLGSADAESMS